MVSSAPLNATRWTEIRTIGNKRRVVVLLDPLAQKGGLVCHAILTSLPLAKEVFIFMVSLQCVQCTYIHIHTVS